MGDIALRFTGVGKSFAGMPAVVDFSLEVRRGEFFGLVGENGAGKTTLIKCMLDFCDTDGGSIEIFELSHRLTAARGRLAYLPERFNPPFYLTGREFLQYLLSLHRTSYDETRITRILEALDLDPAALSKPVRTYSKGMTQKLGLASCLLSDKELYVMDEPTSGLDPKARALFKREVARLRNRGHTAFFTSHALPDLEEMCDRMAILHAGRLRFAGTPGELRRRFNARDLEEAFLACIAEPAAAA
ncbi:MAG: ABC transporter ATP-binding protein [Betaproteobacteria bacterium]|nr:ABC transporter ATP-binding protein [Betaproteobacteria bacterium]